MRKSKENREAREIKVVRASEYNETTFFDMVVNGVTIYGCTFKTGKNGDFVSFPSHKSAKDGKYYNHVYVDLSKEEIADIDSQLDELL